MSRRCCRGSWIVHGVVRDRRHIGCMWIDGEHQQEEGCGGGALQPRRPQSGTPSTYRRADQVVDSRPRVVAARPRHHPSSCWCSPSIHMHPICRRSRTTPCTIPTTTQHRRLIQEPVRSRPVGKTPPEPDIRHLLALYHGEARSTTRSWADCSSPSKAIGGSRTPRC